MMKQKLSIIKHDEVWLSTRMKWILQIVYWAFHLGILTTLYSIVDDQSFEKTLTWFLVTGFSILFTFYSYFYFIIPRYLGKANIKFALITIAFIVIYPLLKYFIDQQLGIISFSTLHLDINGKSDTYRLGQEIGRRLFTILWNIPFALFARFTVDWFKNKRIKTMMETQQLKSELAMLRNQVNPHFLFNVLNNIDAMVYPHSEEASEAIVKLSSIMRYMLYESDVELVNIEKEINYINAYVDLQRMRLKPTDQIKFSTEGILSDIKVAPMIFIPFIENAFKHATRIDDQLIIDMKLSFTDGLINMVVSNSFNPNLTHEKDNTGGIGLSNVQKRLALIYPEKHTLVIKEEDERYQVNLTLEPIKL